MILPLDTDLRPVITADIWKKYRDDTGFQKDQFDMCRISPWYMLVNFVYTVKRDDQNHSTVERFPADEYLRYVLHKCFTEPFLVIDKSRQMRLTWIMMFYLLWNAMYHTNEMIICQTKKKEDVDEELIKRAHFMYQSLPTWLRIKCVKHFCRLSWDRLNSQILGIPSGADQIRSHNPNRVFLDEGGFFEGDFEDCRSAALACASDIKIVSTANAGEFADFVEDRLVA